MLTPLHSLTPSPPRYSLDLGALWEAFDWLRALDDVPQDPEWHGEGTVGAHERLVLEALASLDAWRSLDATARRIVFAAALLHDVAKPERTREEHARTTSPGHARRGAVLARRILWQLGFPFHEREAVVGLVAHHMAPFFLIDQDTRERRLITITQTTRADWLGVLARADALGRVARDQRQLLDNVALFEEYAREVGCLDGPFAFGSAHSRFLYFRRDDRDPRYVAHDDTRSAVTVMSGLPGSGKNTWIAAQARDLPVVALDDIRAELDIRPDRPQGAVVQAARERAREFLRAGQPFVWNATNVSREIRGLLIDRLAAYNARVRIVYCEADPETLRHRNRSRRDPRPDGLVDRLVDRWQVPDLTEAHEVEYSLAALGPPDGA